MTWSVSRKDATRDIPTQGSGFASSRSSSNSSSPAANLLDSLQCIYRVLRFKPLILRLNFFMISLGSLVRRSTNLSALSSCSASFNKASARTSVPRSINLFFFSLLMLQALSLSELMVPICFIYISQAYEAAYESPSKRL